MNWSQVYSVYLDQMILTWCKYLMNENIAAELSIQRVFPQIHFSVCHGDYSTDVSVKLQYYHINFCDVFLFFSHTQTHSLRNIFLQ